MALLLLLAACSAPVAPQAAWVGVSADANGEQALTVLLKRAGTRAWGEYTVGVSTGAFEGTVENGNVVASLTASPTCTYQFQGTMTANALTGSYDPGECQGGLAGTWDLSRP
jgi:hypothetical protein